MQSVVEYIFSSGLNWPYSTAISARSLNLNWSGAWRNELLSIILKEQTWSSTTSMRSWPTSCQSEWSQVSWFSHVKSTERRFEKGDKIPLSSSLKGKALALNWGRQNINHTLWVLLSIHHQIPIETLKCERLVFLLYIICQFGKSKGYFYMLGALKKSRYLFFSTHYLRSTNFDRSLYQGIYRPIFRRWPSRGRLTTRVKWISLFFCY